MLNLSDIELLSQLYSIHSLTGEEWELIDFVRKYVAAYVPSAKVRIDRWGNLYITKGKGPYPTLVCHLDQVQALHSVDFDQNGETPVLPSGVYLVKVSTLPARKVVVMR